MLENKPTFIQAIKAAQAIKTKISPETAATIQQTKKTPKSQVTTNKPNIVNITYGRDVGYRIEQETFDDATHAISATRIRREMGLE